MFEKTSLEGVIVIAPTRIGDARGWFSELFRKDLFQEHAGVTHFVQHNQSFSAQKGTVRGLHFQLEPKAQGKLVRCLFGCVLDVIVDLRSSSPTYGQHVAIELSPENGKQVWIPAGFAHGFCAMVDASVVFYMTTDYYSPQHDRGLRWNDPALKIEWPVDHNNAILSEKDKKQPLLAELGSVFS